MTMEKFRSTHSNETRKNYTLYSENKRLCSQLEELISHSGEEQGIECHARETKSTNNNLLEKKLRMELKELEGKLNNMEQNNHKIWSSRK